MPASRDGFVAQDNPARTSIGPWKRAVVMVDASSSADNGVWIDASDFLYFTVHVFGTATSGISVQVYGSNAEQIPTTFNATDAKIGAAVTAFGLTSFTGPYRWINIRSAAPVGGTVGVNLQMLTQ